MCVCVCVCVCEEGTELVCTATDLVVSWFLVVRMLMDKQFKHIKTDLYYIQVSLYNHACSITATLSLHSLLPLSLQSVSLPLQGFLNAIVYGWTSEDFIAKIKPREGSSWRGNPESPLHAIRELEDSVGRGTTAETLPDDTAVEQSLDIFSTSDHYKL